MKTENASMADTFEMVVRDSEGKVKDTRYVTNKFNRTWEFNPNKLYLNLINKGQSPMRIPILMGTWTTRK